MFSDATGRQDKRTIKKIIGHSDIITDFAFSPFDDGLVATGSQDQTIKLWRLPSAGTGLKSDMTTAELVLPEQTRRVETVTWHPTADCLLTSSSGTSVTLWDCVTGAEVWTWSQHQDQVQSVAWQWEGKLMSTTAKDKKLRVFDIRVDDESPVQEADSHDGVKDSKVVWVTDNIMLTSGFGQDRARQLIMRDVRNIDETLHVQSLDVSAGTTL